MPTLSPVVLHDKVRGCWLGKNIGGTLGGPFEGNKDAQSLTFYRPVPNKPLPNDDLDLQLAWLVMLERLEGREPTLTDFATAWRNWLRHYPWDEYGICSLNLAAGLQPPISGCFRNGYIDNMGSPIRSEIWACIAIGDPERAALLAMRDAILDHAGGEGMYGEMFWAALQAAAFVEDDPRTLITIGLNVIPLHSQIARVVREALVLRDRGLSLEQARHKVAQLFSNPGDRRWGAPFEESLDGGIMHPCHAVANHGFTILGWLYGTSFGDMLCKAVNCGYDTDCTGATLGATLGILNGAKKLPEEWVGPVGEGIVLHRLTGQLPEAPTDVGELTRRTLAVREKLLGHAIPEVDPDCRLFRTARVHAALRALDPQSATVHDGDVAVTLHYHGEPVLYPNEPRYVALDVTRNDRPVEATIKVHAPPGWRVTAEGRGYWLRTAEAAAAGTLEVDFDVASATYRVGFAFLSPSDALWPVECNVPRCAHCGARVEACLCGQQ